MASYKLFQEMKWDANCNTCGASLPQGSPGWGTKTRLNSWKFLCKICHANLALTLLWSDENEYVKPSEPQDQPTEGFLERIAKTAPWRFADEEEETKKK